ncbi:hypothetical protein Bca52824_041340 [Brassica carinata]|uniref:Uncharacterized protein n=1 Tax=Brassica carinata TaxID=52824 RepID=A0A8X7RUY7_BRACI|nr:hypothetical protein Bca52824_041340 [Brassica carinata]
MEQPRSHQTRSPARKSPTGYPLPPAAPKPYSQRLDRHGRRFGDRVSLASNPAQPLKNKITAEIVPRSSNTDSVRRKDYHSRPLPIVGPSSQRSRREDRSKERPQDYNSPGRVRTSPIASHSNNDMHHANLHYSSGTYNLPPRPPLERNLNISYFTPPPTLPVPSIEEVMEELREVTYQYTNCPDPTESAARRQRVLDSESRGLMEETTARIIEAASAPAILFSGPTTALLPT